ncbi:aldo/keto reductase, partial [Methylobacterium nigriterrae]|uniref:aldo/keto reductase n=1 Tax=Methylobacterium nigriterrae TaxID=3127512 RepID=UPI0030134B7C
MSDFYACLDRAESVATLQRVLHFGVTFLDTADMYGIGRNEELTDCHPQVGVRVGLASSASALLWAATTASPIVDRNRTRGGRMPWTS